jgi:hypothetical protein
MKKMFKRLLSRLGLNIAFMLVAATMLHVLHAEVFARPARTNNSREVLMLERDRVRAERRRWEKLIEVQQTLSRNPHHLARAAEDAARELKGNGIELVVEGLTGGLSNFLSLQAAYAKADNDESLKQQYKVAAATVSTIHTLLIKDLVKQKDPNKWKPSVSTEDMINKLNSALKLVILIRVRDKNLRNGLTASLDLSKGMSGFLNAYLHGDQITMTKLLPATKAVLAGTLTMIKALAANPNQEDLKGLANALAKRIPAFGPMAKLMATTALTNFNISLALANIGWGGYALTMGMNLEAQAEEIRDNQQKAAVKLQRLLPRAQAEIARAAEAERRLTVIVESMGSEQLPRVVQPSMRFIDNGIKRPIAPAALPDTLSAVRGFPSLAISITVPELKRRQDQFREETRRERDEERRRLNEARRIAREKARRRAKKQRAWARQADIENDTRSVSPSYSVSPSRSSKTDFSRMRSVINSIPNVIIP